jgi:hypothetical protein
MTHRFFPVYAKNVKDESLQKKYSLEEKNQFKQEYAGDGDNKLSKQKIDNKLEELQKKNTKENIAEIKRIKEMMTLLRSEFLNEKGKETRKSLAALGGEPLSLETTDGANLDGFFLDASKFRQKLHDAQGELITFSGPEGTSLKGIAFDLKQWKEKTGIKPIMDILKDLNVLDVTNKQLSGWTPVRYVPLNENEPSKLILVPTVSLPGNEKDEGWIQSIPGKEIFEINAKKEMNPPILQSIDVKSKGGTVRGTQAFTNSIKMKP